MKKQILASLLIASPTFAHGMENNSSFLSSFSWSSLLPAWLTNNESELISDLRKDTNNFKNKLKPSFSESLLIPIIESKFVSPHAKITIDPKKYLDSHTCLGAFSLYYLTKDILIKDFDNVTHALSACQSAQIDGYSCIGAVIIANKGSIVEKRSFIRELINRGFKPTTKDIRLTNLIFYDEISEEYKRDAYIFCKFFRIQIGLYCHMMLESTLCTI